MFKKLLARFHSVGKKGCSLLAVALLVTACSTSTAYTVEQGVDSTALTAMTTAKVIYKHACTKATEEGNICASKETVEKAKAIRVILWGALQTYWDAVDAYSKAETTGTSQSLETAKAALQTAISQAMTIFSTEEVLKILSLDNSKA
jgi:hypothetical protein